VRRGSLDLLDNPVFEGQVLGDGIDDENHGGEMLRGGGGFVGDRYDVGDVRVVLVLRHSSPLHLLPPIRCGVLRPPPHALVVPVLEYHSEFLLGRSSIAAEDDVAPRLAVGYASGITRLTPSTGIVTPLS